MLVALQVNDREHAKGELLKQAVSLLSQQVWCWGQDILRPEGNWLLEIGFDRIEPPADRKDCASVYALAMPQRRCVVLRGFGEWDNGTRPVVPAENFASAWRELSFRVTSNFNAFLGPSQT